LSIKSMFRKNSNANILKLKFNLPKNADICGEQKGIIATQKKSQLQRAH